MSEQMIKVTAEDGHSFDAFRAIPDNPIGSLVILQEIFGMTEQLKGISKNHPSDIIPRQK